MHHHPLVHTIKRVRTPSDQMLPSSEPWRNDGAGRTITVVQDYSKWFLARLRTLEPVLSASAFLCAARFTAADISVGYALLLARHLGLSSHFTPAVAAYWQRLQVRDGFANAIRAQERAALAQKVSTTPSPHLGLPKPMPMPSHS